jgi:glutathione synthase/RimK-type ligase-like ATP-grasp enzyme
MVLIISEEDDLSTQVVIDWLVHFKKDFTRINNSDKVRVRGIKITNDSLDFEILGKGLLTYSLLSSEIKSFWYRRGEMNLDIDTEFDFIVNEQGLSEGISAYLYEEKVFLQSAIYKCIESVAASTVDNFQTTINRKFESLLLAKKVGLKIPATAIVQSIEELNFFVANHGPDIVTKGINENIRILTKESYICSPTVSLNPKDLGDASQCFFPTLIQKKIAKEFDVRVFYIKGKAFAAAIFTSNKYKDEVDFRVVSRIDDRLLRIIPYSLDEITIDQLNSFMKIMGRDSGSFDLVQSSDGQLYFLEMNPVGQFGFLSDACNYYIERYIAKNL